MSLSGLEETNNIYSCCYDKVIWCVLDNILSQIQIIYCVRVEEMKGTKTTATAEKKLLVCLWPQDITAPESSMSREGILSTCEQYNIAQ